MAIKYLFGANANKIQRYVFNSNKFKEIVGASKIIEQLSDGFGLLSKNDIEVEIVQNTTGSFKAVFPDLESLNKFIVDFNKKLAGKAPNLLVTQAVLKKEETEINDNFSVVLQEIDDALSVNRNFPNVLDYAPMIGKIYPLSGFTAVKAVTIDDENIAFKDISDEDGLLADFETRTKLNSFENSGNRSFKHFFSDINISECIDRDASSFKDFNFDKIYFESEFDKMKNKKSLIAVVHSDGNGTGFLKKDIFGKDGKSGSNFDNKDDYKTFSENLNRAVKESACYAIINTFKDLIVTENKKILPFRIFTLSGEDFNFTCHPDYVFELLRNYVLKYEELTSKYLAKFLKKIEIEKMTTTAGISFSKSHFPFHMSFDLAESLCGKAKQITKENLNGNVQYKVPGALLFHFVQSSYFSDLDHVIDKERKSRDKYVDFLFGPYVFDGGQSYGFNYPSIDLLIKTADIIKKGKGLRGAFRELLSIINLEGEALAIYFLKRAVKVNTGQMKPVLDGMNNLKNTDYYRKRGFSEGKYKKSVIYDMISIESSIDAKWSS